MYYEPYDIPTKVQSSNLNEELGQINYVFSDKTGTLTQNVMEFRKMSVNGVSFGTTEHMSPDIKIANVDFVDPSFDPRNPEYYDYILHLACCHTIIAEERDGQLEYQASSPDELALTNAARAFGIVFLGRDEEQNMIVSVFGERIVVKLLNVIEFSSARKRMTVIVQLPDGRIKALCKGADTMMEPRLSDAPTLEAMNQQLEEFATEGLRTLVLAERVIPEAEYVEWNEQWADAMNDIHNREARLEALGEIIEKDFRLLGATAIEDKLQDLVPDTIYNLRQAGIKIWVLTGDKIETAINIGYSCSLLTNELLKLFIDAESTEDIKRQIKEAKRTQHAEDIARFALIVSGGALLKAMKPELNQKLLQIAEKCDVVLACRVSPQQKADIVRLVRDNRSKARTLSIGDGANDVNMILAAHVGVGISGLEGQQAVRASDYAVGQFSYLKRLLFVHGRECYRRNAILVCFNFYKNVLLVMPLFYYGMVSIFSGQPLYNVWTYQIYNVVFTTFPIIFYAIFDREIRFMKLERNPKLFELGLYSQLFNTWIFWKWIIEACLQAIIICFVSISTICIYTGDNDRGTMDNMWVASNMVYGTVVIFANIKVAQFSYTHYWFTVTVNILSILSYFLITALVTDWLPISEWLDNFDSRGSTARMFNNPNAYLAILWMVVTGFMIQPTFTAFYKVIMLSKKMQERKAAAKLRDSDLESVDYTSKRRKTTYAESFVGRTHTGFAFSGEAGHTPQLTSWRNLFMFGRKKKVANA